MFASEWFFTKKDVLFVLFVQLFQRRKGVSLGGNFLLKQRKSRQLYVQKQLPSNCKIITVNNASGRITFERKIFEQEYCAKLYLSQCLFQKCEWQNKETKSSRRRKKQDTERLHNLVTRIRMVVNKRWFTNVRVTLNATAVKLV